MEKCRGDNDGQNDFQKIEEERPVFLFIASQYIYGLGTLALSALQQHTLHECENNNGYRENSRCKESGEKENERPKRRSWN